MTPTEITLHQKSHELEIAFDDGTRFRFPYEFLRVHSPSAEVRGHGPGQEVLQVGKKHVLVTDIEPVGSYAMKISFDDGHDSGLYTWEYLQQLGKNQTALMQEYIRQMHVANEIREPGDYPTSTAAPKSCGH
jgi:DUF971 family protein